MTGVMKRVLDLFLLLASSPIWVPAFCLVAILVRINLGSPIFFRQERAGFGGAPFQILKFRTMMESRDKNGELLPDAERLTTFGKWIRSASLDELPGLINVIRGEMSLVGPRPLPFRYLDRYTPEQNRRHEVPPGVTGWAQINGRNAISWEERFELDVWYVANQSLLLDLRIMARTLEVLFSGRGVTARDHATMPEFLGSAERRGAGESRQVSDC